MEWGRGGGRGRLFLSQTGSEGKTITQEPLFFFDVIADVNAAARLEINRSLSVGGGQDPLPVARRHPGLSYLLMDERLGGIRLRKKKGGGGGRLGKSV